MTYTYTSVTQRNKTTFGLACVKPADKRRVSLQWLV